MGLYRILTALACASAVLAQAPPPAISMSVQGVAAAADPRIKEVIVGGFQPPAQPGGQPTPIKAFTPESVTAQPGDTIRFTFLGDNHAIMQSTMDNPCVASPGGFTTPPQPNPNNDLANAPKMDFKVPDGAAGPLYMTVMDTANCGVGMVLTVNPPLEGQAGSHTQFKQKAIQMGSPNLQIGGLVQQQAAAQVANTISIQVAGQGTPGATPQGPPGTVVQGTGRTGAGQACSCQCLCGGAVAAPQGIAQGNFGGIVGQLPAPQAPMAQMAGMQAARYIHRQFKPPLF